MILAILFYYGAAAIPLGYLLIRRFQGQKSGLMLKWLSAQVAASLIVIGLIIYYRSQGYREWYWAWAYNIPVNVIFTAAYVALLTIGKGGAKIAPPM